MKNKGKEIISKTEQKLKNKITDIVDKAFPHFDYDKADTKYNKQRFKEYIEVKLTPDVTEIYCYGDFLGADYKVLFSFSCDSSTIQRIIKKKEFVLTSKKFDNGLLFMSEFHWWDKETIKNIRAYKMGTENEFWQYLWYDTANKKAYYGEYSL